MGKGRSGGRGTSAGLALLKEKHAEGQAAAPGRESTPRERASARDRELGQETPPASLVPSANDATGIVANATLGNYFREHGIANPEDHLAPPTLNRVFPTYDTEAERYLATRPTAVLDAVRAEALRTGDRFIEEVFVYDSTGELVGFNVGREVFIDQRTREHFSEPGPGRIKTASVENPPEADRYRRTVMYHNHPADASFSPGDVMSMAAHEHTAIFAGGRSGNKLFLYELRAVRPEGTIEGDHAIAFGEFFREAMRDLGRTGDFAAMQHYALTHNRIRQFNRTLVHEATRRAVRRLNDHYGEKILDYRVSILGTYTDVHTYAGTQADVLDREERNLPPGTPYNTNLLPEDR